MANWKIKVKFRDLLELYDDMADDELEEIARVRPFWVERFESYACLKRFVPSLKKVKTEAGLNKWLDTVYDYCDANLIWVDF